MEKESSLEIQQDSKFNDQAHKVKLGGKIVLVLIMIAVMVGLTGKGPVSRYTSGDAKSGVVVTTQHYTRYESPMEIEMLLNTKLLGVDSVLDISFPASYMDDIKIESILPEPDQTIISNNRIVFHFVVKSAGEAQRIIFYLRPRSIFHSVEATVKIEEKVEAHLKHFIYP